MEIILDELKNKLKTKFELFFYEGSQNMQQILDLIVEKGYYIDNLVIPEIYKICEPIACIKLKKQIVIPMIKETDEVIHIIHNETKTGIYICVSFSHPHLWYFVEEERYDTLHEIINNIIKCYNPEDYPESYQKNIVGFIGSEQMLGMTDLDLFENLIIGEWNELFTWGSLWEDHPFRETLKNTVLSEFQYSKINLYANQQMNNQFVVNVKTQISKSQLTFVNNDGLFYVYVNYNSCSQKSSIDKLNHATNRGYPLDAPIDVIQCLIDYPFITNEFILKIRPLTVGNFIIANTLANDLTKTYKLLDELKNIIDEYKDGDENENIIEVAKDLYKYHAINIVVNKISMDDSLKLDKNKIKKRCIEELKTEFNLASADIDIDNIIDGACASD